MKNQIEIEYLIRAAREGDKKAEDEIFSKLNERFSRLIRSELQTYQNLKKWTNLDIMSREICFRAIAEVKRLYPLKSLQSFMDRAVAVLRNIKDDSITNLLTDAAQKSDYEAEHLLFKILRKKLMQWINNKRWRKYQYECQDK